MEVINGEWIMKGCSEDDPDCLRTAEDAAALIQIYGFLPFFSTEIPGFSLEEHTLGSSWWTGKTDDPWMWRMELARHPDIAYGKFFHNRAGFVSRAWFPTFANYRRNGYDFEALCEDALASYKIRTVMDAFGLDESMCGPELMSYELKEKLPSTKGLDGNLTSIQMQTFLIISDFRQRRNKRNAPYGMHIAALMTPETKWGYDHVGAEYDTSPAESWNSIVSQVRNSFPSADDPALSRILRIRHPGASPK